MRFKLDENLDGRLAALLADHGHEADSVPAEGLSGASDEHLFGKCAEERRVLVTLDLDFADPLRFPPAGKPGIMVLRPQRNTLALIRETLTAALPVTDTAQALAAALVESGAVPRTSVEDALHIALAAVHGMDFLLTWNFRHINNAETKARVVAAVESAGYECPVICSPEELGSEER